MLEIAGVLGISCVALEYSPAKPIEPGNVARVLEGDRGITHVALVHCETTSGVLNPLTAIAGVVQAAGRRLLVDAMSSFGGIPLDVHDGIDALVASSNKCLEGVPGVAFAISQVALLESSAAPRSVSLDLAAQWRGFEHDGQFRFTPPTHVILALEQALYELDREGGVAGRAARYHANHVRLVDGMRRLGFREVVAPEHQSDIITSFFYPEDPAFTFEDFYARLRERNFVIYPGKLMDAGCFRIGSIGRLYPDDIDALLVAVSEVVTRPIPSAVD
jgi:2-aminoethylphosphonate-pyruvate transaminase